ncbi:MAG TPA: ATP-dependent DNA ligase [Acidimicrobiales bacterium]
MLLSELVATSARVAATRARSQKIAALADTLRALDDDEVVPAVAFLTGEPRQGRVGVGWRTVTALRDTAGAETASVAVLDLDHAIETLAALGGPGSQAARTELLADLFGRATPAEGDFIRRLLTGELRQGALEGVMADAIARAADVPVDSVRRAAMLAGDLCRIAAAALTGGGEALRRIGLEVLRPVQPMLASTAADVAEAIAGVGLASVEWKLDGARVQAHRDGGDVRLFTRNLNDVTERLAGVADVVRSLPLSRVVLDGEVIGLAEGERPGVFQETMSRFGRHDGSGSALVVRFFDVLHLDGADLLDEPLVDRMGALERVASRWRVPAILTDEPGEAAVFLDDALANGHEGVMVKAASSRYEAGRRGSAWRKVKPVVTLDLVVLAAEWGYGRRQGWLSNLHLGARDPDTGGFVMVGKTFKGLTDALLTWQTERFLALETRRDGIVVEVRPELVVEIALDGVQRSTRYDGGVALRFARVRRYREDKTPTEADTIDAVRALLK